MDNLVWQPVPWRSSRSCTEFVQQWLQSTYSSSRQGCRPAFCCHSPVVYSPVYSDWPSMSETWAWPQSQVNVSRRQQPSITKSFVRVIQTTLSLYRPYSVGLVHSFIVAFTTELHRKPWTSIHLTSNLLPHHLAKLYNFYDLSQMIGFVA